MSFIIFQINKEIPKLKKWNELVNEERLKVISKNYAFIKRAFKYNPYGWSWFLNQTGKSKSAKKNLRKLYNEEHDKIMKLKRVVFGLRGSSPIKKINSIFPALVSVSSEEEAVKLKEKNRKLKVHIGNLPQAHIKT